MKHTNRLALLLMTVLMVAFGFWQPASAQQNQDTPLVMVLTAEGPVTPAMGGYLERSFQLAVDQNADLIILELNTPGGAITLMNEIIQDIRASGIPVIVYVTPRGAMAGSAGTLITLAGHASAMAPETAIGAASPVGMQGEEIGETLATKEKEILRATVRSLAARRTPEAIALAEDTIETGKAASAEEALEVGLVDFIANDLNDLLRQLDTFEVIVLDEPITLLTQAAIVREVPLTLVEQALALLTNPNIVFLLLTIGVQAVLIELTNPGGWVAGIIGVICLALVVYSFGILPINLFGLVFIILAFVLFVLETQTPAHGALTVAGVVSFITGALIMFNSVRTPGFPALSIPLVIATGVLLALTFIALVSYAMRALRTKVWMGKTTLVGLVGLVSKTIDPVGSVQVAGELWTAELAEPGAGIPVGSRVEIVSVQGLRVQVKAKS